MSAATERPTQATFFGWLIIGGSVFALLGAFEAMASLRSMETREAIEQFLAEPPGDSLGIGFERARQLRHVAIMVVAAAATAAVVLGIFVLRRDRGARIALSVLAVPLFLAGSVAGGFATAVVTLSVVMLWLEPSRSWFAGRPIPERFRPRERDEAPRSRDDSSDSADDTERQPTPWMRPRDTNSTEQNPVPPAAGSGPQQQPWGGATTTTTTTTTTSPEQTGQQPAPYQGFGDPAQQSPYGAQPWRPGPAADPTAPRPSSVTLASVVTIVLSVLVALLMLAQAALVLASPEILTDEMRRTYPEMSESDMPRGLLVGSAVVTSGVLVLWCVAAIVFAIYALRRRNWARIALIVSAGIVAGLTLLSAILAFYLLLVTAAAVAAIVGLSRPEAKHWFATRPR